MTKTCFAYLRVSTQKQGAHGVSLQEQKSAIEQYALKNEISITDWFEERQTAAKTGRPIFDDMLSRLRAGDAEGVVIHKIDRSTRNFRDWAAVGDLIDSGVEFHFAVESLDLGSRGGRLAADIQAVVAADYIRNLSMEARKGFYGRLKQGLYPLGAPIGYLDNGGGKAKTHDPIRAPLIKRAFELYATGEYSLRSLRDTMQLTNSRGVKVSTTGWSHILNNPFYYGLIRIKRTHETFEGVHEPLISQNTFDQVQTVLAGKSGQKVTKHDMLFKGIFRCALCNYAMIGERQRGQIYYRCHTRQCPNKSIREDELERQAERFLRSCTLHPWLVRPLELKVQRSASQFASQHSALKRSQQLTLENVRARSARLTSAYLEGLLEEPDFKRRKADYDLEERRLRREITILEVDSDAEARHLETKLELTKTLETSYFWGDRTQKRKLLRMVSSNRTVSAKNAHFEPSKPWAELQKIQSVLYCPHPSGETRTKKLSRAQLDAMVEEVWTLLSSDDDGLNAPLA